MRSLGWLSLLAALLILPGAGAAKRSEPPEVAPVTHLGVRYAFPHFAVQNQMGQNGGVVEAREERSRALLWRLKVYEVQHRPDLEGDAQDCFITAAWLEQGTLVVRNERAEIYEVDLARRTGHRRAADALPGKGG
jgi:hypothetical protein